VLGGELVDFTGMLHNASIHETALAMQAGVSVIIGGALPDDVSGARRGRPDLLIRSGITPKGLHGYLPADIKSHKAVKESVRGSISTTPFISLADDAPRQILAGLSPGTENRLNDLLQLAHYWRQLEACGHAADDVPRGGLIGSDTFAAAEPFLLWQRLDEPVFATFSRSRGKASRSALERYDHEFEFRRRIAATAQLQGTPGAPEPLVRPIIIEECDGCPFHDACLEMTSPDDPSRHITSGRLGVREWNALRTLGITTLSDLASLDPSDAKLDHYWAEVEHPEKKAKQRLSDAVTRAQMRLQGEQLRRITSGTIHVPSADVEVDFDIEWDGDERIYLWGLLANDQDGSWVVSEAEWSELDDQGEQDLAKQAIRRLFALREGTEARGQTFLVYHYSHPEITKVRRLLERGGTAYSVERWEAFTSRYFVDLHPIVKEHFIGVDGLGLKQVAPWAGFEWEDEDPGGEQSLEWIEEARTAPELEARQAAVQRILSYNTDDLRATLAVRNVLREQNA
jgi:predicted RecB family nuclease